MGWFSRSAQGGGGGRGRGVGWPQGVSPPPPLPVPSRGSAPAPAGNASPAPLPPCVPGGDCVSLHPCPGGTASRSGLVVLCRTSKFWSLFCTHTAHDGGPGGSDSLSDVISAISRGGVVAPALRPVCADHLRGRAADAGRRGRDRGARSPGTPYTPGAKSVARRAASHAGVVSRMADNPPLVSPCGIASERTGDPGPWRRVAGEEPVLPSTSRNGARQESEDNADQAGRSQGRAAREGGAGR